MRAHGSVVALKSEQLGSPEGSPGASLNSIMAPDLPGRGAVKNDVQRPSVLHPVKIIPAVAYVAAV
jgi:hypothetical protein